MKDQSNAGNYSQYREIRIFGCPLVLLWILLLFTCVDAFHPTSFIRRECLPTKYDRFLQRTSQSSAENDEVTEIRFQAERENLPKPDRRIDICFASPLLEFGYPPAAQEYEEGKTSEKPLFLFLPGFDGTYLSAFFQYPELHTLFEVRCLVSSMNDRSTFDDLKNSVIDFIFKEVHGKPDTPAAIGQNHTTINKISFASNVSNRNGMSRQPRLNTTKRPIYLVGESFGGILASDVALTLLEEHKLDNLKGLVLINSATCYDRSRLAKEGLALIRLPKVFYLFGILRLLPMFLDDISLPQFMAIIQGKALPSIIDNPIREAYMGRVAFSLPRLLKLMPQETFQWRLERWLEIGCSRMASKLDDLSKHESLRALIIAGEKDLTLPSIAEAERLTQRLRNSQVHVVNGAGHANTCGSRLDLAALMRNRFEELRTQPGRTQLQRRNWGTELGNDVARNLECRTAMKPVAAEAKGVYFGMEPRYDGKWFGLSPLKYWSKEYYSEMKTL